MMYFRGDPRFFCMPPFLFTYQLDLAMHPTRLFGVPFGGKANRIAEEALQIRDGARHHWFQQPFLPCVEDESLWIHKKICLPLALEAAYHRERAASNRMHDEKGLRGEPDWAFFQQRC